MSSTNPSRHMDDSSDSSSASNNSSLDDDVGDVILSSEENQLDGESSQDLKDLNIAAAKCKYS